LASSSSLPAIVTTSRHPPLSLPSIICLPVITTSSSLPHRHYLPSSLPPVITTLPSSLPIITLLPSSLPAIIT
ncbi:hepatitis A virus cellular receptor 1-like, partial [Homarus americanus]|uniref:hepatitis A virus cellular receptor 1-like n=1 Tax=Homarus americanus TaxID=6706 RepID=UPI001C4790A3